MNIERTWRLLSYALAFALCVSAVYALIRLSRLKLKIERPGREFLLLGFVFYLSALIAITAVRGKFAWNPGGNRLPVNLEVFKTTLDAARSGPGALIYHALGNALWFVPLGLLPPILWRGWTLPKAALAGLLLSSAIEATQWLFATGMLDVDDVLLNTLGAALGYGICAAARRLRGRAPRKMPGEAPHK